MHARSTAQLANALKAQKWGGEFAAISRACYASSQPQDDESISKRAVFQAALLNQRLASVEYAYARLLLGIDRTYYEHHEHEPYRRAEKESVR